MATLFWLGIVVGLRRTRRWLWRCCSTWRDHFEGDGENAHHGLVHHLGEWLVLHGSRPMPMRRREAKETSCRGTGGSESPCPGLIGIGTTAGTGGRRRRKTGQARHRSGRGHGAAICCSPVRRADPLPATRRGGLCSWAASPPADARAGWRDSWWPAAALGVVGGLLHGRPRDPWAAPGPTCSPVTMVNGSGPCTLASWSSGSMLQALLNRDLAGGANARAAQRGRRAAGASPSTCPAPDRRGSPGGTLSGTGWSSWKRGLVTLLMRPPTPWILSPTVSLLQNPGSAPTR